MQPGLMVVVIVEPPGFRRRTAELANVAVLGDVGGALELAPFAASPLRLGHRRNVSRIIMQTKNIATQ